MTRMRPLLTLVLSAALHGTGALGVLYFVVGDGSPPVLFVDLTHEVPVRATIAEPVVRPAATPRPTGPRVVGARGRSPEPRGAPAPSVTPEVTAPAEPPPAADAPPRDERASGGPPATAPRESPPAVAQAPAVAPSEAAGVGPALSDVGGRDGVAGSRVGGIAVAPGSPRAGGGGGGGGDSAGTRLAFAVPGTASGSGPGGAEYGDYLAAIRRRIQESLRYPLAARRRGLTGTVHLEIVIRPDGAISAVSVADSSSHRLLDTAAVEAVRGVGAVPFPPALVPRTLRVKLPVVFELE